MKGESLKDIIESWIYNSDTIPEEIDIETATEYRTYITPEMENGISGLITPETIMNTWNMIIKEEYK